MTEGKAEVREEITEVTATETEAQAAQAKTVSEEEFAALKREIPEIADKDALPAEVLEEAKEQGISLMLRTMSPQWIVVDEVTAPEDIQAMQHAGYCGVRLAATAHAADRRDLQSRALYRQLVAAQIFTKLITIRRDRKITVEDL